MWKTVLFDSLHRNLSEKNESADCSGRKIKNHRKSASRRLLAALSCVGLLASLTACSAPWKHDAQGQPDSGSAQSQVGNQASDKKLAPNLTALFDQYLAKKSLSNYEREVLTRAKENGKISSEDYQAAHTKETSCLAAKGWKTLEHMGPGGFYINDGTDPVPKDAAESEKMQKVDSQCAEGVSKNIEYLYVTQQSNPELLADDYEATVHCLHRHKIADGKFTAKKLKDAMNGTGDPQKKIPFDMNTDDAMTCFAAGGMA
ncbi:hypothetical protein OZX72_00765 [Bifidobacterium sp. ESL0769]|uniref:hypothetical protein n=1 Tax=Bifidobacterium sp. ESL0769 TaxID=2983229 RepID=UPI0023F68FF9|nr:hypothetical protein [Bifidobacterium sp. ESL0769]WEV67571.1 hypothetical protein OZX72_00765 [Bifidobacterium sp. ESL0769]